MDKVMKTVLSVLLLLIVAGTQTVFMASAFEPQATATAGTATTECGCAAECGCQECVCATEPNEERGPAVPASSVSALKLQWVLQGLQAVTPAPAAMEALLPSDSSSSIQAIGVPLYLRNCAQLI
jgi:hypothetical protein